MLVIKYVSVFLIYYALIEIAKDRDDVILYQLCIVYEVQQMFADTNNADSIAPEGQEMQLPVPVLPNSGIFFRQTRVRPL